MKSKSMWRMVIRLRTGTIRQKVFIPAVKPERVYKAILSSKEHSEFTGSKASCTNKVGGRFTAWDGYISGKNIELAKGSEIVQEWRTTEWPEDYPPSILKILLKGKGDGTELTMIQSKVPASQVKKYTKGWYDSYWSPMKQYFKENIE